MLDLVIKYIYKIFIKNYLISGLKFEKIKLDFIIKDLLDYKVYIMELFN